MLDKVKRVSSTTTLALAGVVTLAALGFASNLRANRPDDDAAAQDFKSKEEPKGSRSAFRRRTENDQGGLDRNYFRRQKQHASV
jgi:hypothetical protein